MNRKISYRKKYVLQHPRLSLVSAQNRCCQNIDIMLLSDQDRHTPSINIEYVQTVARHYNFLTPADTPLSSSSHPDIRPLEHRQELEQPCRHAYAKVNIPAELTCHDPDSDRQQSKSPEEQNDFGMSNFLHYQKGMNSLTWDSARCEL